MEASTAPHRVSGEPEAPPVLERLQSWLSNAFAKGDRATVLRLVRAYRRTAHRLGDPTPLGIPRVWLAALVEGPQVPPRALKRAARATAGFLASGQIDWAIRSLAQHGRLLLIEQDWTDAMELLATARQLAQASSQPVPVQVWAPLLYNLGLCHWRLGHRDDAERAWREALLAAEKARWDSAIAHAQLGIGLCLWARGDPAEGYVHASAALNWYRREGSPEITRALFDAAVMMEDFGHWEDAVILLEEARDLALREQGPRAGDVTVELVHARISLGQIRVAMTTLEDARALYTRIPEGIGPRRTAELLMAEGRLLLSKRQLDDALDCFRRAQSHLCAEDPPLLTQRVLSEMCLTAEAMGRLGEAVAVLDQVLLLSRVLERPGTRIDL